MSNLCHNHGAIQLFNVHFWKRSASSETCSKSNPVIQKASTKNEYRTWKTVVPASSDVFKLRPLEQRYEVREGLAHTTVSGEEAHEIINRFWQSQREHIIYERQQLKKEDKTYRFTFSISSIRFWAKTVKSCCSWGTPALQLSQEPATTQSYTKHAQYS